MACLIPCTACTVITVSVQRIAVASLRRLLGPEAKMHEVHIASRFNANTAQALRKATLAGLGIALLPATLIRSDLRDGRLVPVLTQYQRTSHGLHVLYPSRQHLPPAVSAFIALVMDKLRDKAFLAR